jgi:tetratricopeptide (TPR) repeat protein
VTNKRAFVHCGLSAALMLLFAVGTGASEAVPSYPILGGAPLVNGTVVEIHADVLPRWAERGYAKATLLHVDTHDDMRLADAIDIRKLKELRAQGLLKPGRASRGRLYDEGNFVRVAAELGIVGEVYWVAPFDFFLRPDGESSMREYLRKAGFPESDVKGFRFDGGCFKGVYGGIPLTICGQETLPTLTGPVLLSIDAAYFPYAANYHGFSYIVQVRNFFKKIFEKRYAVLDTVLSYSVDGSYLPANLRWLGDIVLETLQDPSLVYAKNPPPRWVKLQAAATLMQEGRAGEVEEVLKKYMTHFEEDSPSLLMALANAQALSGGKGTALENAEKSCMADKGYCYGLLEIGIQLLESGDLPGAEPFFAAADRLNPGIYYGEMGRGVLLAELKEYDAAQKVFELMGQRSGMAFPSEFLIGSLYTAKGDRKEALRHFKEAVSSLDLFPSTWATHPAIVAAVQDAARLFREEGDAKTAERLENDPRFKAE